MAHILFLLDSTDLHNQCNLNQIPASFIIEIEKLNFKMYVKVQKTWKDKKIFEKNKVVVHKLSDFKSYYKATIVKKHI